ncbi:MAG: cytochrome d ubiquinol oxidase subunit II [Bacteroidales bacterium]|nr:cytochrome d ubiquinol oxidase subunit II [Bacteroidales bacterium]MCF8405986.1 cytochrome d ubiquinol oxidase subunit II [Bacteroidales bacterium]
MFENLSHLALQQYWWVIISLLAAFLVFLMFVQGGQTLIFSLGKTNAEKTMIVNALGRKWEFTFTTLVTFGGAFFASFPLFYSTSFGGAYWVWMAILFCFIIQAVAYEFRSKPNNFLGSKTYEIFLLINGILATILVGTAVGTFFNGGNFVVDSMFRSKWANEWYGLEAVTNFHNVALGIAIFALSRILAIHYFQKNIDDETILTRSKSIHLASTAIFLITFLYWLVELLIMEGFAFDPDTMIVSMEKYKYLHNFIEMPVNAILFLAGVVLVLYAIIRSIVTEFENAIWFSGIGTILVVFSVFILAGFNNTCFYPSAFDLQSSLHIQNASSSHYTLTAMSYVSLFVPVVIAYIIYAWRAVNNKKIDKSEMESHSDTHVY